ncbi:MAG TPA: hypothetical protein VGM28_02920 [Candidatus Limnocylindrales bacterium]
MTAPAGPSTTSNQFANPLSDPRHWSKSRDPRTAEEVEELAAWTFREQDDAERYMLVAELHPDLAAAGQLSNAAPGAEYLAKRRAAIRIRGYVVDPAIARDVDAAAAALRALDAPRVATVEALRSRMTSAFGAGSFADLVDAFLDWQRASRSALEYRRQIADLRRRLALSRSVGDAGISIPAPDFVDALNRAADAAAVASRRTSAPGPTDGPGLPADATFATAAKRPTRRR